MRAGQRHVGARPPAGLFPPGCAIRPSLSSRRRSAPTIQPPSCCVWHACDTHAAPHPHPTTHTHIHPTTPHPPAGLVVASDQTGTLERGYWPSYNASGLLASPARLPNRLPAGRHACLHATCRCQAAHGALSPSWACLRPRPSQPRLASSCAGSAYTWALDLSSTCASHQKDLLPKRPADKARHCLTPPNPTPLQIPFHPEVYSGSGYPQFLAQQAQRGADYAAAAGGQESRPRLFFFSDTCKLSVLARSPPFTTRESPPCSAPGKQPSL